MARYTIEIALRWSDMDSFGHVNNCRYMTVLEEARVGVFFKGPHEGAESFRSGVVVARHEIDYLLPMHYSQKCEVALWVDRIGGGSFDLAYEVFADGKLAARAKTVMVPFDMQGGHSRRLNDSELTYLRTLTDDK